MFDISPDSMLPMRIRPANGKYSAKNVSKPVNFVCRAEGAKRVFLSGDFNHWNPGSHPFVKRPDGNWFAQVELTHGHHHYVFVVDGQVQLDPNAQGIARNSKNERVSMIAVS